VVIENIIDDDRSENAFGLMMSLNMLIETAEGFDFTAADLNEWATEAGFVETYAMRQALFLVGMLSSMIRDLQPEIYRRYDPGTFSLDQTNSFLLIFGIPHSRGFHHKHFCCSSLTPISSLHVSSLQSSSIACNNNPDGPA